MDADVDFDGFVSARWVRLYRLAYLLTTDEAAAEDLLQTAMEKTFARWPQVARMESPEAYVRTLMVNAVISDARRPGAPARVAEGGAARAPAAAGGRTGRRPPAVVAAGVRPARAATGGGRAALLRGPRRARGRRRARLRRRHGEVADPRRDPALRRGLAAVQTREAVEG